MNQWICRDLVGFMGYFLLKEEAVYASILHGELYDRMVKASEYRDKVEQKMVDYNCQRRLDVLCQKLDIHLVSINDHNYKDNKVRKVLMIDLNHNLGIKRTRHEERRLTDFFNRRYGKVGRMRKHHHLGQYGFIQPHFFCFKNPNLTKEERDQIEYGLFHLLRDYGMNCEMIPL